MQFWQIMLSTHRVFRDILLGGCGWTKGGVFSEPAFSPLSFYPFFYESARLAPYELTHVRPSPGDCAAGWAQAWRKV